MAEEIRVNMEAAAGRGPQRWSQEESLSDEGKAPMAELPGGWRT